MGYLKKQTGEHLLHQHLKQGWKILCIGFVGFLIWATTIPLDQGVPTNGKVIVEGHRKIIQHQLGGIIDAILIKDGDHVNAGDVLITLNNTSLNANYTSLIKQKKELEMSRGAILKAIQNKVEELNLIHQRIDSFQELVNQGFLGKNYLNDIQQRRVETQSDIASKESEALQLQSKIVDLSERIVSAKYDLSNTEIKSPVDGIIMDMQFMTLGGVISPGVKILEVSPNVTYEIELQIPVNLIDQVKVGDEVSLQFSSLNRSSTPRLKGKLIEINPDRQEEKNAGNNPPFFKAKAKFNNLDEVTKLDIKLGMAVQAYIKTGERSLMSYLMKPLIDRLRVSLI